MRPRVVLTALLVLTLSILSAVFAILAATSKSWATQAYYFDDGGADFGLNETRPTCIYERSPFYRCNLPTINESGVCTITDCAFYKAYGQNQTSCRSSTEYGRPWAENFFAQGLLGGRQECQQSKSLKFGSAEDERLTYLKQSTMLVLFKSLQHSFLWLVCSSH